MLAALNFGALGLGLAAGGLAASLVGLLVGGGLALADLENGADIGLLSGIVAGLTVAGFVAGKLSVHSHRFHGSVVGLMFAGMLILLASFGKAQISVLTVLWLAVVSSVVAGLAGWLGGRKPGSST
jgi:hypothetical protein